MYSVTLKQAALVFGHSRADVLNTTLREFQARVASLNGSLRVVKHRKRCENTKISLFEQVFKLLTTVVGHAEAERSGIRFRETLATEKSLPKILCAGRKSPGL